MTKYWKDYGGGNINVSQYIYDVDNLRVGKTENVNGTGTIMDVLKRFTYDGQNLLYDGTTFYLNNIALSSYEGEIYGDRNVAYLKDAVGTVRGELYDHPIVDKLTSVETSFKRFDYTAFGEKINIDANTNDTTSGGVHEGIGFTGHYGDSESGLYYARARYLDPSVGRWLTRDSFEDYSPAGLNKYQDCANNPVRYVDPMGQDFFEDVGNFFTGVGNAFVNGLTAAMGTIGSGFAYAVNGITAGIGAVVGVFNPELGQSIMNQVADNISRLNLGMNYMWNVATHITESPKTLSYQYNPFVDYQSVSVGKNPLDWEADKEMQDVEAAKVAAIGNIDPADGLPLNNTTTSYNSQPMQLTGDQINVNNTTDNGKPKTMNDRADEIFYQLHPELSGKTIADVTKSNPVLGRQLAFEWQGIKDGLSSVGNNPFYQTFGSTGMMSMPNGYGLNIISKLDDKQIFNEFLSGKNIDNIKNRFSSEYEQAFAEVKKELQTGQLWEPSKNELANLSIKDELKLMIYLSEKDNGMTVGNNQFNQDVFNPNSSVINRNIEYPGIASWGNSVFGMSTLKQMGSYLSTMSFVSGAGALVSGIAASLQPETAPATGALTLTLSTASTYFAAAATVSYYADFFANKDTESLWNGSLSFAGAALDVAVFSGLETKVASQTGYVVKSKMYNVNGNTLVQDFKNYFYNSGDAGYALSRQSIGALPYGLLQNSGKAMSVGFGTATAIIPSFSGQGNQNLMNMYNNNAYSKK
jgi:RHS repeat-associated protein